MKNIAAISSSTPTSAALPGYSNREDGFIKMLNKAINDANHKEAVINQARKEQPEYSLQGLDQSSISLSQMNTKVSPQAYISSSMLSLYLAQENRNEKPARSRAAAVTTAI